MPKQDSSELYLQLLSKHDPEIRAFVRALVPSAVDVADVMQNVSVVAWKKFAELDEPAENFGRWCCVIARYEVLKFRRSKARDRLVLTDELVELISEEAEAESRRRDAQIGYLEECLSELPEKRRILVQEAYAPGSSVKEMAKHRSVEANSLYQMLWRIRQELARCIEGKRKAESF